MTLVQQVAASTSTDALFRAWAYAIHTAILACGWAQSSSAGTQINFATVSKPVAANDYPGYAVYYATDAIAATTPLYMRLDFGQCNTPSNQVGLKIQIGLGGVDTSGNLTGVVSAVQIWVNSVTQQGSALLPMRTAGNAGSFRIYWPVGATANSPAFFAVERDQSLIGVDTALGAQLIQISGNTSQNSQFLEAAGGVGPLETKVYAMVSAQSSQSGNSFVGAGPVRCTCGVFRNPMKTVILASRSDFASLVSYPGVIYGVTRNYLICSDPTSLNPNGWNATTAIGMLWE